MCTLPNCTSHSAMWRTRHIARIPEILECAGKILFPKNRALLCERDSLKCVCQRADVRDTRVALNHRFLDYRVTRGKAEKDFVETREEDERVRAGASEMRGRDRYGGRPVEKAGRIES